MANKYEEPPAYVGSPGPQPPQPAYHNAPGGSLSPYPNQQYGSPQPGGPQGPYGPPPGQQYYQPGPQMGYYPPQQGQYPPQQGGYYPQQGPPPQGYYRDDRGGGSGPGFLGACLGALACCCCLDMLF